MITQDCRSLIGRPLGPNGFILVEVLVAMSLIMGSWMVSNHVYQKLVLSLSQQERKRTQLRREIDAHELAIHSKADMALEVGGVKNDAARVPGRNHVVRHSAKSPTKGQR